MCGIAGFVDFGAQRCANRESLLSQVVSMSDQLIHRGPDSCGHWVDPSNGIGLGHRRLSIVDTSSGGAQPMLSGDDAIILCFNGEIYNHKELRQELESLGIVFKSTSDTEVLIAAIQQWGLDCSVDKLIGQFAFALVDKKNHVFHLVRDRAGEKPLYYGWVNQKLVFASELKAFEVVPNWKPDIDRSALCLFFRHNYIPAPSSIYQGVYKLSPASILSISLNIESKECDQQIRKYWDLFSAKPSHKFDFEEMECLISESVKRQMVADVPVGAFLSGGVDSSTIVALMSEFSHFPVQTFTIGFDEPKYNEAAYAAQVAGHLGTDHHEFILSAQDALNIIPDLPRIYDEPFADSSQLPTFLVSKMTRTKVTVALSGDGGDELFCGYERYFIAQQVWRKLSKIPRPLKSLLYSIIQVSPTSVLNTFVYLIQKVSDSGANLNATKLRRLAKLSNYSNFDQLYHGLISHELNPETYVREGIEGSSEFSNSPNYGSTCRWSDMMARDINSYLPDDILTKVDRASMANSLEVRVPLLSHDVMEQAWLHRPTDNNICPQPTKKILRDILYKRVPKDLIERPKVGFAVPMGDWLSGSLKNWVIDLLDSESIRKQGILNHKIVSRIVSEHYSKKVDHKDRIWNLVTFQAWLQSIDR